jgi:hypothetical protein
MITKNRICWGLIFLVLIGILASGIYFLNKASNDPQGSEISRISSIITKWNHTFLELKELNVDFQNKTLTKNQTQTWALNVEDLPYYKPLFFSGSVKISDKVNKVKVYNSTKNKEYNITTDVTLTVMHGNITLNTQLIKDVILQSRIKSTMNAKVCGNEQMGFWDGVTCYHDYQTTHFCFVIDSNYSLTSQFELGCDAVNYYQQQKIKYRNAKVYENLTISPFIEVRSSSDPYVYASYNGISEFSPSSSEYKIIGITLVVISSVLLVASGFMTICTGRKRKYLNMHDHNKI